MTIDTLNPEPPTTAVVTAELEPRPASSPTEKPRLLAKPLDDTSRCHYRYPNGRRCALPGLPAKSGLCLRHYNRQVAAGLPLAPLPNDFEDLSQDLLPGVTAFSSSDDLRNFLTRLLFLMTEGRVSPRRASVMAYVTTQLLHTHVVAEKEADQPEPFIFDLPRPKRD